ncbi:hypothetical protein F5Y00DRAFT_265964 [Daldinia vernicosa]|uniref:uncharacterized protein n=1 Tax=Daldinia vernicosa TaxID=114800 RepID=UPI002007481A|nr:uncharacterized protein F5Y00DRAFT_265964 [Daldinia vernicosa]KAI0844999.1 hypothetical protein F5Y00DRAFT_265964 [Daldinia vernicosa]
MAQANQRKLSKLSAEETRYIINHVFLPPQLPHENDYDVKNEEALLKAALQSLNTFREYVQGDEANAVESVITTMEHLHRNHDYIGSKSSTDEKRLLGAFCLLNRKGGTVACHIQAQNCGILFSRLDASVQVEVFELSPSNQAVISTEGRLRRLFPGAAVSIPLSVFQTREFQDTVAYTLIKMTHQSAPDTQPQVRKDNKMHDEDRDTTHPKIITELFFAFLLSMGNEVEVTKIWKNTREEVFWQDAKLPWHRSALWLLIRVVLQLLFTRSASLSTCPEHLYKTFMIYFMAQVLAQGQESLSSDLLVAMSAKISRRYHKIVGSIPGPAAEFVNSTLSSTDQIIRDRWSRIREENMVPNNLEDLQGLNFDQDTHMSLSRLVDFIHGIGGRGKSNQPIAFQLSCPLIDYSSQVPPVPSSTKNVYVMYELALFESWVASNLQSWLGANEECHDATGILREFIENYYRVAFSCYEGNPELSSIMILTILDLWVASDKSAIRNCKLLKKYKPGIPLDMLENLNLPTRSQMIRLCDIEKYLIDRRSQAPFPYEALNDFGSRNCFSVQFFNQSVKHEELRASIVKKAHQDREAKRKEFQRKKDQYDDLIQKLDEIEHDTITRIDSITGDHSEHCTNNCLKCDIPRQAKQIKIGIHEWPLPRNELQEKSTVFELDVPCSFRQWRDTTVFVLYDILKLKYLVEEKPVANYRLADYLPSYFRGFDSRQRVILLSGVKPHTGTHRRMKAIATMTVDDVCLENGLRLRYYDKSTGFFTTSLMSTDDIAELCTYSLPKRPTDKISPIQPFINRTPLEPAGPPPNKVIATQSTCPTELSLEEYKALASLPLGFLLQWQNILLQLASPSIDFRKEETALVILQCIFQVGPRDGHNVLRSSHKTLVDAQFSHALLDSLDKALLRVRENWQSFQGHGIFVSIARRLLSLTSSQNEKDKCLTFLADIRKITSGWIHDLEDKIQGATDDDIKEELRYRLVKITLICADTFNVEEEHLRSLLAAPDSACTMIRCSIVINEGLNCIPSKADEWTSIMHRRWERLAYRAFNILADEIITKSSPALDDAIKKTWSDFPAAGKWEIQKKPYNHWIVNRSTLNNGDNDLYVVFSLLTGELFVNGSPLGRLPREYEKHYMYSVLFGKSILEVVPSSVPGMRFSSKKMFNEHSLNFGLDNSAETLLIRAVANNQTFELVPRTVLQNLFPIMFVDNFVHWYNEAGGYVEFCPQELPWTHSEDNWRLVRSDTANHCWRLCKGSKFLVDINSHTAKKIFKTNLNRLEEHAWTHIILQGHSVDIEFPRLKLGFHLKQGDSSIYSHQFRGMSVDEDQSIGTLIGLQSMLVLKGDNGRVRRKALIPNGNIVFYKHGQHVHVNIERQSSTKAYVYEVDGLIGRLANNGSLQGRLLLSYLHALTSFPLPDPLTGKTGTEEALSILNSAAVRSFIKLTEENLELLKKIALLTPARYYYPANEREMQTVVWNPLLDFLAQHNGFYQTVRSIFDQANTSKFFHPESYVSPPILHQVEQSLLRRDTIRSSTFRVSGFGAEDHTTSSDVVYRSRDNNQSSEKASRARIISKIIFRERFALNEKTVADLGKYIWEFLSGYDVLGPRTIYSSFPEIQANYDSTLLIGSTEFIAKHWIQIYQLLSDRATEHNKFKVMFWLSTISFDKDADMTILQILASFFTVPGTALSPPTADIFRLSLGSCVSGSHLYSVITDSYRPFHESPEADLSSPAWESWSAFRARQSQTFQKNRNEAARTFRDKLITQWPCERPTSPYRAGSVEWWKYINVDLAMSRVTELFKPRYHNHLLENYLNQIGGRIPRDVIPISISRFSPTIPPWNCTRRPGFTSNDEIFNPPAPLMLPYTVDNMTHNISLTNGNSNEAPRLPFLLSRLDKQVQSGYDRRYVSDLKTSTESLQGWRKEYRLTKGMQELEQLLAHHRDSCQEVVDKTYEAIKEAVKSNQGGEQNTFRTLLASIHQWPRLSPSFFLQRLCRSKWQKLSEDWKSCIVYYGITISRLQRADRLLRAVHNPSVLISELRNPGHTNWRPQDQPESLLLEIEGDLMIRPVQEQIANNMRSPEGGRNAVMQLNMGEGKSSVIVPMVATALADGSRLVRVIVGKPQSRQMYQMLISKLGGLLDRQIYHLPFSRAVKVEETEILAMRNMFETCKSNGGIFLMQPEHILSFKLMGIECILTGKEEIGRTLVQSQEYLNKNTRDIVDESDENFSVKFELVYTMGTQRPTEYSPERWVCIHQVLEVVREVVLEVRSDLSGALEVHSQYPGCFPRTRILQLDAADQILSRVTERICATGINGFPITRQQEHVRQAIIRYITEVQPAPTDIALVEDPSLKGFWTRASQTLLLLRGLIAGGVLGFAFGHKRWRVDYGLDSNRQPSTKLAVPYRAKDNPSLRSEFSHPDVVIILTSLSYYYGGLEYQDLLQTFEHLLRSDQADQEFGVWVKDADNLPNTFKTLVGINLEDVECTQSLFNSFRHAKGVIDYFLAHIVFPKEMKEFSHRLSASGWDIGEVKTHPTTGFSGTNDSRQVLPYDVEQLDLEDQKHTNALVLENLLHPKNSVTLLPPRQESENSVAEVLLNVITKLDPPTRVILDVGAQILELNNFEVAKTWLHKTSDDTTIQAAIFVDDHDELHVLDRKGHSEPLHTSPFVSQLDVCVVFLDEAHTRGTDLKLPRDYRAAVTLGANLTKDRLVQACMRMRMLAEGQSVVFCVPDEVQRKIRAHRADIGLPADQDISVLDILAWSIGETWKDIHRSMALWANQGRRNETHRKIWAETRSSGKVNLTKDLAEKYLEEEAKTLEYRYRPRPDSDIIMPSKVMGTDPISLRCNEFKNLKLNSAELQEEEERELSPEIEQERQDQRPPAAEPAIHTIHEGVKEFIASGMITKGSKGYMPAFLALRNTSAGACFDVSQFRPRLLVSNDFANTIKRRGASDQLDSYQRAIQWILTGAPPSDEDSAKTLVKHMMVISPYEANAMLPMIMESKAVALHLYAPRANLGYCELDKLDLYTVPERLSSRKVPQRLITELNLFAGQLYFGSYEQYVDACRFLGISYSTPGKGEEITADGFIAKDSKGRVGGESGLKSSPVAFFKILHTKIRRNCESIEKTHMGKLLDNQLLRPSDFEEQ